mmetsp:Transcript_13764/g.32821  ORF Transcript_13764/g.32821 Transcript_13764/m.32821 type:complete len:240 (-) Transcript_13764:2053-2772(-)
MPPVLFGISAAEHPSSHSLNLDHLAQDIVVPGPCQLGSGVSLQPRGTVLGPPPLKVSTSLLRPQQCLHMTSKQSYGHKHASPYLAAPGSLDQRRALDQQLQTSKLYTFVGWQLEEDQRLANCPRLAMLWLWDVQFCIQVLQQLLGSNLGVLQMPKLRDDLWQAHNLVVIPTLLVINPDRIACSTDLDNLQDTTIAQLLGDTLSVEKVWQVLWVRLDASDKVGLGEIHDVHQAGELLLEL